MTSTLPDGYTLASLYQSELRRWIERLERHVDQLPLLLETLRERAVPLRAARLDERVTGGGGHALAPLDLDAIDAADYLWAVLAEYVGEVAERLQQSAPGAVGASWATQNGVQGIPAWMSADDARRAGYALSSYLCDNAAKIHALELRDSERHLYGLISGLTAHYIDEAKVRGAHRRHCAVCDQRAVVVDWLMGDAGEAKCLHCGQVYMQDNNERNEG